MYAYIMRSHTQQMESTNKRNINARDVRMSGAFPTSGNKSMRLCSSLGSASRSNRPSKAVAVSTQDWLQSMQLPRAAHVLLVSVRWSCRSEEGGVVGATDGQAHRQTGVLVGNQVHATCGRGMHRIIRSSSLVRSSISHAKKKTISRNVPPFTPEKHTMGEVLKKRFRFVTKLLREGAFPRQPEKTWPQKGYNHSRTRRLQPS